MSDYMHASYVTALAGKEVHSRAKFPPGRSSRASVAAAQSPRADRVPSPDPAPAGCEDDELFTDPDLERTGFRHSLR